MEIFGIISNPEVFSSGVTGCAVQHCSLLAKWRNQLGCDSLDALVSPFLGHNSTG